MSRILSPLAWCHPKAQVGLRSKIGPFAEIGPEAVIGDDCVIHGCVEGKIGHRTKVWRFAHVMKDAVVGDDCQVCNGAIVLSDARVGDRVDVQLWVGVARLAVVEDDVFIGPNVVFCNAKHPVRGMSHDNLQRITLRRGCSIGANSSLLAGIEIGECAVVGAGSVVTKDVPAGGKWVGSKPSLDMEEPA